MSRFWVGLTLATLGTGACGGKGGPPSEGQAGSATAVAEAWVTTGDQTKLLVQEPNAAISTGEQQG